ncbi:MAG: gamma-butyrobetaine hydroxylase-like domain-containing protein, partial [Geminicoccaceae bacterium]
MSVVSAGRLDDGQALEVCWADGSIRRFHAIWLRDNALDEATRSSINGQRLITLDDIPASTRVADVTIIDGALDVLFTPEGRRTRYPSAWLRDNAYDRRTDVIRPHPPAGVECWDCALDATALSDGFQAVSEQPKALCTWLDHIRRFGFAKLTGGPLESGALLQV